MKKITLKTFIQTSWDIPFAYSVKKIERRRIIYNYNKDFENNFVKMKDVHELPIQHDMYDHIQGAVLFKIGDSVIVDCENWDELIGYWTFLYIGLSESRFEKDYLHTYAETYGYLDFRVKNSEEVDIFYNKEYKATANKKELMREVVLAAEEFFNFLWTVRPKLKKQYSVELGMIKRDKEIYCQ
ncbi:hypothetical protein HBN50_02930 [Halobacteriovorax sp. GB3]|uniref:hypothetical protein n=1 Tax=Halobacteriovorax sp. GB3 TaxID=2719615 RepID=UPI00236225B4|nr:hypothetical protein [Halobacteriovorax sp. GB3]MDD0852029.1 hypothetical protein [Halobacteriovorax sp. GB3]